MLQWIWSVSNGNRNCNIFYIIRWIARWIWNVFSAFRDIIWHCVRYRRFLKGCNSLLKLENRCLLFVPTREVRKITKTTQVSPRMRERLLSHQCTNVHLFTCQFVQFQSCGFPAKRPIDPAPHHWSGFLLFSRDKTIIVSNIKEVQQKRVRSAYEEYGLVRLAFVSSQTTLSFRIRNKRIKVNIYMYNVCSSHWKQKAQWTGSSREVSV